MRFWWYDAFAAPESWDHAGVSSIMKISDVESGKAVANQGGTEAKILPKDRPRSSVQSGAEPSRQVSPLEKAMAVAEAALKDVPDTRDELVEELKQRIRKGEYEVSGEEIAEMMMRRLAADRIR